MQYEAIKKFDALNPEKGYNKRIELNLILQESSNIHFAKENLDFYFNMFNPDFPISEEGRQEEKKEFIEKILSGRGF